MWRVVAAAPAEWLVQCGLVTFVLKAQQRQYATTRNSNYANANRRHRVEELRVNPKVAISKGRSNILHNYDLY